MPRHGKDETLTLRLLAWLNRRGTLVLVLGLLIGLALPPLAHLLRPVLSVFVFLLTTAAFLSIDWKTFRHHATRPLLLILIPAWLLVAAPVLATWTALALGLSAGLSQGLVLWAGAPALTAGPAFAMLLGLDGAIALLAMVSSTLLMPLILPPLALGLIGLEIGIGVIDLMVRLGLFVAGAALLAALAHRICGPEWLRRNESAIGGFNVLILHLFAIAVMDGVGDIILATPLKLVSYTLAAFAANLLFQVAGSVVFWWLGRIPALTVGMVSGMRNMAVVIANLGSSATPEIALFFVAVQFPIYMLPAMLAPLYRRFRT